MANQLTPATLDITVTKITAKTVWYTLTGNGNRKKWSIPSKSTFNTSVLVPGTRYIVKSTVVLDRKWVYEKRKYVTVQRYDWTSAMAVASSVTTVKIQARTAQQRAAATAAAAMPLIDDGSIFRW